MSGQPSLLISTTVTPVHQAVVDRPAFAVMSSKRQLPLLRYKREETWLPAKKRSGSPSLLKSPTPTPPPMYVYSSTNMLSESLSVIVLLKAIPVAEGESKVNLSPGLSFGRVQDRITRSPIK